MRVNKNEGISTFSVERLHFSAVPFNRCAMDSSAKQITAINKDTIHRICSGQVVLNLATAVKELVENSLDAGATIIEIRMKEYGSELIEVNDNGKGIQSEDFEALALKHHTSKIRDFGDLVDVETFGFRGEALSSLCAVSEMIVTTRHADEDCGSKLKFDYKGVLRNKEPFPRQTGTTITLTNLFASLPVRQKEFHRNLKKEFTKTVQLLSAYCLIANNVKISCVNQTKKGGKTAFLATQENKTIRENISCVFGSKQLTNLLEITGTHLDDEIVEEYGIKNVNANTFQLRGFISSCEHGSGRSTTDRQFYYINSRPCEPTKVMKLTNEIYHRYNLHQYPFILLNIIIPKESVDVNVTPDKRLIFVENEKLLLACVKSTLIRLFENIPSTYRLNTPVSVVSGRNCPLTSDCKVSDQNKNPFDLSQWKHSTDKTSRLTTIITAHKRYLSQPCQNTSNSKQMKLDQVFKITSKETKSDESATATILKTDPQLLIEAKNESLILNEHNIENAEENNEQIISNNTSGRKNSHAVVSYVRENKVEDLLESENQHIGETIARAEDMHVGSEHIVDDDITAEEVVESIVEGVENARTVKAIEKFDGENEFESVISKPGNAENFTKKSKAVIDTSIEILRRIFRDGRGRRKNNANITNKFHVEIDPTKNQVAEEELKKEISKSMFNEMKIVGQFNLGFIIAKLENDLFIIDQHATDEKYNFETLQRTTTLKSQKLIAPQDLNLTATNECILFSNINILRKNGFEFLIDPAADTTKKVKLISVPTSQNWQFGKDDIDEMLFMLQDAPNTLCRPSRIRAMFASRACRKSVMIGMPLSISDMRRLINNMGTIEQPWNCPHGRPTMRHLVNLSLLY